jgi:hypothetical protein
MLMLFACSETADVTVEDPPGCGFGFVLGADGRCYEVDTDTADPADADTDTDSDTDTDTDTDTAPEDVDGDGYSAVSGDCNDFDAAVNPGAVEVCNETDDDCNGEIDEGVEHIWYNDDDDDGYGDRSLRVEACDAPRGYVGDDSDCDDDAADVHPDADDDQGDGLDNDCDGVVDEDFDPCSVAYGWAEWTSPVVYPDEGIGGFESHLDGPALLCDIACDAWWVSVDSYSASACPGTLSLPATADDIGACWSVIDPGTDREEATCTAYTSAGYYDLTVIWN